MTNKRELNFKNNHFASNIMYIVLGGPNKSQRGLKPAINNRAKFYTNSKLNIDMCNFVS